MPSPQKRAPRKARHDARAQARRDADRRLRAWRAGRSSSTPAARTDSIEVRNTGDRPIQVGSHFHFFEANRCLEFDRAAAFGMRLDIPATTAVRFEPGDEKDGDAGAVRRQAAACMASTTSSTAGPATGRIPDYRPNLDAAAERAAEARLQDRHAAVDRRPPRRVSQPEGPMTDLPPAVRRPLRPDGRRQDPAGRHRPLRRDREGPARSTATSCSLRRRQDAARRHGLGQPAHRGGRLPRPRHHQRDDRRRRSWAS